MTPWNTELTPLSFLSRSARVYPDKIAVIHGEERLTYRELAEAAEALARALRAAGVAPGDRVAYLMANVPDMLVAHFGVPLAEAVLVAVNTRLSSEEVRYICDHSEAVALVVDPAFAATVAPLVGSLATVRTIVMAGGEAVETTVPGAARLEEFLAAGDAVAGPAPEWSVRDERATISINYTSGTTGRPKGVMYTHRGAYLNALGEVQHSAHTPDSVYLWTLPMFHCNGWCTAWALAAVGGTQVCLREVRGEAIWELIGRHRLTHLNGAPTVLTTIMSAESARPLEHPLVVTTAGAPPSPSTIERMERLGFAIVHVYGLTETYGPYTVCQWQPGWASLDPRARATLQSRQGVGMVQAERVRVVRTGEDGELEDVAEDGHTMGEIVMRGNNVMKGYFRDPEATEKAFTGGWFHSGDLGVMHPDGYIELRDRAKDIIVSGGENISTVEVEHAIAAHAAVLEVAVIGVPDQKWGERPKAFVVLRPGHSIDHTRLLEHIRSRIARYKAPREIEFVEQLPRTSTGKVRKYELREKEWSGQAHRIQG